MSENESVDHDTEEADRRNGEPGATSEHPTGQRQAKENAEKDPPA